MSLAAYLRSLDRLAAVVEALASAKKPKRRRIQRVRVVPHANPPRPVVLDWAAPAPVVLPEVVRASLDEGLLTEAEAMDLAGMYAARRAA